MSAAHCRKKHPCPNLSHHRSRHNLPTAETNVRYHPSRPASQHQLKAEVMPLLYTHDQPASMMNCFQCCSDICGACLAKEARSGAAQGSKCSGKSPPEEPNFLPKQPALKDFRGKKQKFFDKFLPWTCLSGSPLLATAWWGLRCRIYAPVAWKADGSYGRLLRKGLEWCFKVGLYSHNGPVPSSPYMIQK